MCGLNFKVNAILEENFMSEIIRKHRADALYAEDVGDCSYLSILVETLINYFGSTSRYCNVHKV
jgi:hypothetical protein